MLSDKVARYFATDDKAKLVWTSAVLKEFAKPNTILTKVNYGQ